MIEARPYQESGVADVIAAMRAGVRSVVRVLPTGGGKTVEAALLVRATKADRRILFLVHRRELVRQAHETLSQALPGETVGVEAAGWPATPWARVRVASVQSLARRLAHIPAPHIVFIDEAHHARASTWERVLGAWPRAYRIGLTATPERLDGLGLGQWFSQIILGPSPAELIKAGWLAPTGVYRVPASERMKWQGSNTCADPVHAYQQLMQGLPALFFGRTVQHSVDVCAAFRAAGIVAEHVDGTDSDTHRDALTERFRSGDIAVLGNCQLFDEGFDVPSCVGVMVGRRTKSVTRWLQMCGRGMRPAPGKQCVIADLAGTSWDLGLPDEPREWSLEDGEVRTQERGGTRAGRAEGRVSEPVEMVSCELSPARAGERLPKRKTPEPRPGPKASRADLNRMLAKAHATAAMSPEPGPTLVRSLEEIGAELGYRPGWAQHMARRYIDVTNKAL